MDLLRAYTPPLIFLQDGRIYSWHVRRTLKGKEEDVFSGREALGRSAWSGSLEEPQSRTESNLLSPPWHLFLTSFFFISFSLFLCSSWARTHIIDSVGVRYKMSIRLFGERNIRRGVVDIDFFVPFFQENVLSQECNWSGHYETRLLTCTTEFQMDRRRRNNGKGAASISSLREWRLVGRIQIECDSEIYATVPLCLELKNG